MSIYNEIMNIQIDKDKHLDATCNHNGIAYKMGYRDAWHLAAEISLRYELELQKMQEELEEKTRALRNMASYSMEPRASKESRDLLEKYNNI